MSRKFLATTLATLIVGGFAGGTAVMAEDTTAEQKVDDIAMVTKIKTDLLQSGRVDGLDVNVDVKEGRVTLSGTASTDAERSSAAEIARGVKGVKSVDNRIMLKTN